MKDERIEREFKDERGEEVKMIIEPTNPYQLNMGKNNYRIAKEMRPDKMKKVGRNLFVSDIGVKSGGFAQVFFLASLVAIAGVVVAYLLFSF